MSYQILKENSEGEAATTTANLPPYPAPTNSGFVYVPLTNQQQNDITETVTAGQPQSLPQIAVEQPAPKSKPAMLIFTIVLAIVCGIHLCIPAFFCLAPALIFAIVGYSLSDSPVPEQKQSAKAFHGVALCCNVFTLVYYAVAAVATIVTVGTFLGLWLNGDHYYHDYYYGGCYTDCSPRYDYYDSGCVEVCA